MVRHLVLDIETALDREAVEACGRSGPAAFVRPWLHRVVAVSTLGVTVDDAAWRFGDFALHTFLAFEPGEEPALLDFVETRLAELENGVLLTFNGEVHDLPTLEHRRLHHWLFGPSRLRAFRASASASHQDLMQTLSDRGAQRWPTLVDVCAGLAIPCDPTLQGRGKARLDPFLVKGQTDVIATFLLHCFCAAAAAGSDIPLVRGWTALADHVLELAPGQPHLTQFATAPMALAAREKAKTLS